MVFLKETLRASDILGEIRFPFTPHVEVRVCSIVNSSNNVRWTHQAQVEALVIKVFSFTGGALALIGTYCLVTFAPHSSPHVTANMVERSLVSWQFLIYFVSMSRYSTHLTNHVIQEAIRKVTKTQTAFIWMTSESFICLSLCSCLKRFSSLSWCISISAGTWNTS